ncbi:hypothetical protein KR009_012152, partial [Drosophila setifemur]
MRTNAHTVYQAIADSDFDVIVLVQTWLISCFYDAEYFDTSHLQVFRKDGDSVNTQRSRVVGVIIAVRRNFYCK